jgi:hypothetical protein
MKGTSTRPKWSPSADISDESLDISLAPQQLAERFGIARGERRARHAWLARSGYLVAVPGVGMVVTPATRWPEEASS